jgi:hypothetical protein
MKAVKVYTVTTKKAIYTVVGTSINDVKEYIEENKRDLNLSFDMSGYYKVSLDKDLFVNWYDMCDENIDIINLTNSNLKVNLTPYFSTSNADYNLLLNDRLKLQ